MVWFFQLRANAKQMFPLAGGLENIHVLWVASIWTSDRGSNFDEQYWCRRGILFNSRILYISWEGYLRLAFKKALLRGPLRLAKKQNQKSFFKDSFLKNNNNKKHKYTHLFFDLAEQLSWLESRPNTPRLQVWSLVRHIQNNQPRNA